MTVLAEIIDCPDAAGAAARCDALERGEILLLRESAGLGALESWAALRSLAPDALKQKNIAYEPVSGRVRGLAANADLETVKAGLREYCQRATRLCATLLEPYASAWRVELTSFRPLEEKHRRLRGQERNDRLHVDSFPSRPTAGARILRCFTNIHPSRSRIWVTAGPLTSLGLEVLNAAGLPQISDPRRVRYWLGELMRITAGYKRPTRSAYDRFMLRLHDYMKANPSIYAPASISRHEFPPGSSWLVFTDTVPHAVLEGQFALEQTFFVPRSALRRPEDAPVAFLERLAGRSLTV